jgi:peptidoglycan/LPS O-acetylase OafA/YrhL
LDGIRAVSILLVFVSHAGLGHRVPGGFGVTVFFFLSGYLITTLLRRESERHGHVSLGKFYLRRLLRIFPPMYITLGLAISATLAGILPGRVQLVPTLFQALHLTNYQQIFGRGKTMAGTEILWSLAVEEHFYLFFPLIAFVLMSKLSFKSRAVACAIGCALALSWRLYLVQVHNVPEGRTYYCTDTRIDSILFGCIMGLYLNPMMDARLKLNEVVKWFLLAASGAMLLFSFGYRDPAFRETFRYTLQGIALFPLFYLAIVDHERPLWRWLNYAPLRFLGILSYTLYLVHFCALHATWHLLPDVSAPVQAVIGGAAALGITLAIYYGVERPCARLRKRLSV